MVTDFLEMNAIANTVGTVKDALEAVKAVAEMVMISHTYSYQVDAVDLLLKAIQKNELNFEQVNNSVARIKKLKAFYASPPKISSCQLFQYFRCKDHEELAINVYEKSVSEIGNLENQLSSPLKHKHLSSQILE
jgi:beta-N-acetylhexosaminidase